MLPGPAAAAESPSSSKTPHTARTSLSSHFKIRRGASCALTSLKNGNPYSVVGVYAPCEQQARAVFLQRLAAILPPLAPALCCWVGTSTVSTPASMYRCSRAPHTPPHGSRRPCAGHRRPPPYGCVAAPQPPHNPTRRLALRRRLHRHRPPQRRPAGPLARLHGPPPPTHRSHCWVRGRPPATTAASPSHLSRLALPAGSAPPGARRCGSSPDPASLKDLRTRSTSWLPAAFATRRLCCISQQMAFNNPVVGQSDWQPWTLENLPSGG